jgi:hypothetical protein
LHAERTDRGPLSSSQTDMFMYTNICTVRTGHGFNPRTAQTFLRMNMSTCIESGV